MSYNVGHIQQPIPAQITSAKLVVPPTRQTTGELAQLIGCDPTLDRATSGVRARHVSQLGDDPAELAAQAARHTIAERGTPDLILYASATARQLLQTHRYSSQRHLGLSGIACYSLHATCLSFLMALHHAALLVGSRQYSKVLLVCAELASHSRNLQDPESAGLLGDGAAAVMLESSTRSSGPKFFKQLTWPEHAELSQVRGGGLLKHPLAPTTVAADYLFDMDGERLLRVTMPKLKSFLEDMFHEMKCSLQTLTGLYRTSIGIRHAIAPATRVRRGANH